MGDGEPAGNAWRGRPRLRLECGQGKNSPTCSGWGGGCCAGRWWQRGPRTRLQRLLFDHLGPGWASLPVVTGSWPAYDHVNVQIGLDAWLAAPGREHELAGITGFRHVSFGLGDLAQSGGLDPNIRPARGRQCRVRHGPCGPGGADPRVRAMRPVPDR